MSGRRSSDSFRSTGSNSSGQPPSKKPALAASGASGFSPGQPPYTSSPNPKKVSTSADWEKSLRSGASGFSPSGQPPTYTSSPNPGKKVSAEWYRDYEKTSFVHDTSHEFEATKIHTQSYDHRIAHIKGSF